MSQYYVKVNGSGAPVVETLTGNSGGAVGPTGNNINTVGTGSITVVGNPGTSTLTTELTGLTNHSLLVGAGTATITNLGAATNGQIPIGSTGADPVLATLTAGANVTITNAAGSITIAASGGGGGGGLTWSAVSSSPKAMAVNNGYVANLGSLLTFTLPASSAVGDEIDIVGLGAGGWTITYGAGQYIVNGTQTTTVTTGSLSSQKPK